MNFGKVLLFGFGDNRRNYNGAACFLRIKKKGKGGKKGSCEKRAAIESNNSKNSFA
jgi:hypothetical protein